MNRDDLEFNLITLKADYIMLFEHLFTCVCCVFMKSLAGFSSLCSMKYRKKKQLDR